MSDKGRKRQQMHAMWPQYNNYAHPMVPPYSLPLPPNYGLYVPPNPTVGAGPAGYGPSMPGFNQHHSSVGFNQASVLQHMNIASISSNTKLSVSSLSSSIGATMIHEVVGKDKASGQAKESLGANSSNKAFGSSSDSVKVNGDDIVTSSINKFHDLTRLALRGSELAEKIAYNHRNRPCFKKIDSLCARMKQDLIRPDGVLPNINSQGIAWAVKDIIFVFTRIINAWIVIKGYVYNAPEGLSKIQETMCPDFKQNFISWQDGTMTFIESLIKSFVSLDNLVLSQKNMHHSNKMEASMSTPVRLLQTGTSLLDDSFDFLDTNGDQRNNISRNYMYTMIEDSEDSQRQATMNGTYFKTGTYNPIKKNQLTAECGAPNTTSTSASNSPPLAATPFTRNFPSDDYVSAAGDVSGSDSSGNNLIEKAGIQHAMEREDEPDESSLTPPITEDSLSRSTCEDDDSMLSVEEFIEASTMLEHFFDDQLSTFFSLSDSHIEDAEKFLKEKLPAHWLTYGMKIFEQTYANRSPLVSEKKDDSSASEEGEDAGNNITLLMAAIMGMKSCDLFFKSQFTKNYFPKFAETYENEMLDLRTIFLKAQNNEYEHIYEMVHDIRGVLYFAEKFLKTNSDMALEKAIKEFELEFNAVLRQFPFNQLRFDHITGDPEESFKNHKY